MHNLIKIISCKNNIYNLTYTHFKNYIHIGTKGCNKQKLNEAKIPKVDQLLKKYRDVIYYCGYIEKNRLKLGYKQNAAAINKMKKEEKELLYKMQLKEPLPLFLKHLNNDPPAETCIQEEIIENPPPTQFPFQASNSKIEKNHCFHEDDINSNLSSEFEIRTRLELYNKNNNHINWMRDYENYHENQDLQPESEDWKINYGTPDPLSRISNVPCGGCGALLHCKDIVIPGYVPSEIFKNYNQLGGTDLKAIICQRCHFLKHYNMALQVRVSPDDYPKVLQTIGERKQALVILMVDLLDFPCSIWPGIADLIGHRRPIVVVGNKVDLLPQDGKGYLKRITDNLENSVRESGFGTANIKHVAVISAKTGFGIENLITKLQSIWLTKGDVFLVGCTNVGKSSLFNALLQSDYCKSQAVDLIQRATISPWPGTTLNLLKFPIMRPSGWRLYERTMRLMKANKLEKEENQIRQQQFKKTRNTKYATLIGHIDRTFSSDKPVDESTDIFSVKGNQFSTGKKNFGIDEKDEEFMLSKWCFDTPGVVQSDQIIHLLTTDELVLTFPKQLIKPKTFSLNPGSALFIAGLARLDYLKGSNSARFTVFTSSDLPITICDLKEADKLYADFLGTELLLVPLNYPERLKLWPGLTASKQFTVCGIDKNISCADLVLSTSGWVAVTPDAGQTCVIQGWTPEKRGIYLRDSLLPNAVSLRGKKIRHSCAYRSNKFYFN